MIPSRAITALFENRGHYSLLVQTLIVAGLGGWLVSLTGLPAPWISGGMIGAAIFAMWRGQAAVPMQLRSLCFIILGFTMGVRVTPETFQSLTLWPMSLLVLGFSVGLTILAIRAYLRHFLGWDRLTATLSAIPGAFSYILLVSIKLEADIPRVAVMQVTRMVVLAAVLPSVITLIEPAAALDQGLPTQSGAGLMETQLALGACGALGILVERQGLIAGTLVGTMIGSVALHGTGLTAASLPSAVLIPCFIGVGAFIGLRLGGPDLRQIIRTMGPSSIAMIIGLSIAALAAVLASYWLDLPLALLLLAYAPGGLDIMAVLALSLNLDPTFVAAHGVLRFIALSLLMPIWAQRFAKS